MKIPMNFRIDETLVNQLKKIADLENRSLTNMIETELQKFVANHSIIKAGQKKKQRIYKIRLQAFVYN